MYVVFVTVSRRRAKRLVLARAIAERYRPRVPTLHRVLFECTHSAGVFVCEWGCATSDVRSARRGATTGSGRRAGGTVQQPCATRPVRPALAHSL